MNAYQAAIKQLTIANVSLTPLRQDVLKILASSSEPLGAYDILAQLQKVRASAKPMTVYRTLATFESCHIVHKIAQDKRYVLCCHPSQHQYCFIIFCSTCGHYKEVHRDAVANDIQQLINKAGFIISHEPIQITACCKSCQTTL